MEIKSEKVKNMGLYFATADKLHKSKSLHSFTV